jgi:hypothetical protein
VERGLVHEDDAAISLCCLGDNCTKTCLAKYYSHRLSNLARLVPRRCLDGGLGTSGACLTRTTSADAEAFDAVLEISPFLNRSSNWRACAEHKDMRYFYCFRTLLVSVLSYALAKALHHPQPTTAHHVPAIYQGTSPVLTDSPYLMGYGGGSDQQNLRKLAARQNPGVCAYISGIRCTLDILYNKESTLTNFSLFTDM